MLTMKCDCCGVSLPSKDLWRMKLRDWVWSLWPGYHRFCIPCLPFFTNEDLIRDGMAALGAKDDKPSSREVSK